MKIINIAVGILLLTSPAMAADLAGLQGQALENRAVVRRHLADLEKSRQDEGLARSYLYPSVDLSYTANWLDEANHPYEASENSVTSGRISLNIFAGFRDRYNIKSAALLRQAEAHKLQGVQQDIRLAVALRYLEIFNRKASLQVAEDSSATLAKLHNDAVNRFEVGLIRKSEMLKFKVDLDNAVIARKKASAELAKSQGLLLREVGAEVDLDQLTFAEFTELPSLEEESVYQQQMLANRSELQFLAEAAAAAAMQTKAARALYYPRVDLASIYSKYDDDFLSAIKPDEEIRTQLVVSMNLFDGFGSGSKVRAARHEAEGVLFDLAEARQEYTIQLQNLFLDYRVSIDNVAVANSSIAQAAENLRVTRLAYEEGVSTESELLDAITSLSRARFNYVAAKSEAFANYFQIIRMVEKL